MASSQPYDIRRMALDQCGQVLVECLGIKRTQLGSCLVASDERVGDLFRGRFDNSQAGHVRSSKSIPAEVTLRRALSRCITAQRESMSNSESFKRNLVSIAFHRRRNIALTLGLGHALAARRVGERAIAWDEDFSHKGNRTSLDPYLTAAAHISP